MDKDNHDLPIAVLIDADNARADVLKGLLDEVAKYGVASVKRIYGDWTDNRLQKWKSVLHEHSIQPMQQFSYTTGKNATDSALIIDAMDLLYTERFAAFCLVSSDSDFTRLAGRLRESGQKVYGFGEKKTPSAFRKACTRFIYIENFLPQDDAKAAVSPENLQSDPIAKEISGAIRACSDENGWASLGSVANYINKTVTDFDPRNHGCSKFLQLVNRIGLFELKSNEGKTAYSIREKQKREVKKKSKKKKRQ